MPESGLRASSREMRWPVFRLGLLASSCASGSWPKANLGLLARGAPSGETARLPSLSLDLPAADEMRWPVFPELGLRASLAEEKRWPVFPELDLRASEADEMRWPVFPELGLRASSAEEKPGVQERRWPSTMGLLTSGLVAVARCRWRRARVAKAKDGAHPARVGHSAVLLDICFAAESLDPAFTPRRVALEAEGPSSQRLLKEAHLAVSDAECFPRH